MRLKESVNALGFPYMPVFFDMGFLPKALDSTWVCREELSGVIPCVGGMHLVMSIISGIGHLYGDAGLRNLLHETGVFAAGTVQQMLFGKYFDRDLCGLRLVDEALISHTVQKSTVNQKILSQTFLEFLQQLKQTFVN